MVGHGPEHVDELVLVLRLHEDPVGDVAEVADVEEPVVSGPVVAREPATVHAEPHRQFLQGHVVNDHVVGPLHEGRVDGQEGLESLRGETAGKQGGVFLGDPDVVVAACSPGPSR